MFDNNPVLVGWQFNRRLITFNNNPLSGSFDIHFNKRLILEKIYSNLEVRLNTVLTILINY